MNAKDLSVVEPEPFDCVLDGYAYIPRMLDKARAMLAAQGLAFVALQFGFQRGGALATAGTATLLTNAVPIAAGVFLFNEHLPGGMLGVVRAVGFGLVVVAAAVLARPDGEDHGGSR